MTHTKHLLIAALVGLVAAAGALIVLSALRPADFGAPPPGGVAYRASSLKENADSPPLVYADEASCAQKSCHGGENPKAGLNVSLGGKHKKIGCQACHGAAQSHVASAGAKDSPRIWKPEKPLTEEERAKLPLPDMQERAKLPKDELAKLEPLDKDRGACHVKLCLGCHQELAGKPQTFPQIASFEKHRKDNSNDDSEAGCTSCHSPHKPAM